jgi:hypothetical protein
MFSELSVLNNYVQDEFILRKLMERKRKTMFVLESPGSSVVLVDPITKPHQVQ